MAIRYELDVRDYIRIIRRHQWKILIITSAVTLISFTVTLLTKPRPIYQATASVTIDKKKSKSTSIFGGLSRPDYSILESEAQLIKSFPIVFPAAKDVGIIPANLSIDDLQKDKAILNSLLAFQEQIFIEQQGDTNIIDITVEYTDPELAKNVANAIALQYKRQNFAKNVKQAKTTREFIETRLNIARETLEKSEEELRNFQENNDVVALDSQLSILLDNRTDAEGDLSDLDNKIDQMKLMADHFRKENKNYTEIIVDIRPGAFSGHFEGLMTKLVDAISKKSLLLTLYTESNPQVIAIQHEITISVNSIQGHLESSLQILANERKVLVKRLDKTNSDLDIIPENNLAFSRLERRVLANNEIVALLDQRYQEALIREADQEEEVRIVRPALLPQTQINPPKVSLKTTLGFAIGLMLSLTFAFFYENFDTSFDTIDDLESIIKIPVIGVIPFLNLKELLSTLGHDDAPKNLTAEDPLSRLIMHYFPKKPVAESFRSLRTNVVFEASQSKAKIISVTSSLPSEGKSTVSANLALSFAQGGKRVLLLDLDLRKSTLHQLFGVEKTPGLVDMVLESIEPSVALRDITDIIMGDIGMDLIAQTPGWDNFDFIPTGSNARGSETEILNSNKLKELIKKWRDEYDYVVIDLPPVLVASDALILSPLVDKMLLVYKVGEVARGSLLRTKALVDGVKASVMGIILNGLKQEMSTDFGQYQYYSDYYRTPEEETGESVPFLLKFRHLIMTGLIVLLIASAFLFNVQSVQELLLKFSGVDFLLTGMLILFIGLIYFGAGKLLKKFPLPTQFPLFSTLRNKFTTILKTEKPEDPPPASMKNAFETDETEDFHPPEETEESTTGEMSESTETEEEIEESSEETDGQIEVAEESEESEETDDQTETPDTFSQEEKDKIDDIDEKLDETRRKEKEDKNKKDSDESDKDDWDKFLGS